MAAAALPSDVRRVWNFDDEKPGVKPPGFISTTGAWQVKAAATAPSPPHVLAQNAKSSDDAYNLALVAGGSYRDADISVKMRALGGVMEQGGGIVMRAKDARNYYVACYNPLDSTYRLYKLQNNGRVELARADIAYAAGWHQLRVVMAGGHLECYFDGKKYLDVRDATFGTAGTIGLWTRGDAQTLFDDFAVAPVESSEELN